MKARVAAVLAVDDAVEEAGALPEPSLRRSGAALEQRSRHAAVGQRERRRAAGEAGADDATGRRSLRAADAAATREPLARTPAAARSAARSGRP